MPSRTKAELTSQIDTLLADNDAGDISEADMRSLLGDINDTFVRPGNTPTPVTHTNYVGISDDATFDVSEYTVSGMSATLTIPTYTGAKFLVLCLPRHGDGQRHVSVSIGASEYSKPVDNIPYRRKCHAGKLYPHHTDNG